MLACQSLCTSIEPFWALGVLSHCVASLQFATVSPFIISHAGRPENRAQAFALHTSTSDVGRVLGATSMGLLAGVSVPAAMQATACVGLATASFFAVQTRPRKHH